MPVKTYFAVLFLFIKCKFIKDMHCRIYDFFCLVFFVADLVAIGFEGVCLSFAKLVKGGYHNESCKMVYQGLR